MISCLTGSLYVVAGLQAGKKDSEHAKLMNGEACGLP